MSRSSLPDGLRILELGDQPDLIHGLHALGSKVWPTFMLSGPVGDAYYSGLDDTFMDCALVLVDGSRDVVGRALWIPFVWDGQFPLPDRGWEWVIQHGIDDRAAGRTPTAASALEIAILPTLRGSGLSGALLDAMRSAVARRGLADLFAPVRPNQKPDFPHESMADFLTRHREDGLPQDAWLRVHARAGGEILGPCNTSMRIPGSIESWRSWTGLDLSEPGSHIVPGALSPVESDGKQAVYVEANVWVHHRTGA